VLGELADPAWDCPTTIAKVGDELLIVCAQLRAQHAGTPPLLPFVVAGRAFPRWLQPA
jgi:hypothetical protein